MILQVYLGGFFDPSPAMAVAAQASSPLVPLSVPASIGMPATAVVRHSGVTYFGIEVMHETGATYTVKKRYQDFEALKDKLVTLAPTSMIDQHFPRKHMFGCQGRKLEARRRGLELWLKGALFTRDLAPGWCLSLRSFLEVDRIHALPAQALHDTFPLSAPSSFSSSPEKEMSEGQPMQVLVPDGVECGQTLAVTVPDGRDVTLVVPPGFPGGSELLVWFDAEAGTLSPVV
ncbi:Sorting nexin-24 [Symbiodinium microadriaticum]|uniref:Sorting nexin-24 n=1 Tax=Symbiodinium microadriaticum TaxID=2951 RepID=A0A1Q9DYN4_SYMMI|nr:Sorting nexin-24 [Symbiodinium microadriaticum]